MQLVKQSATEPVVVNSPSSYDRILKAARQEILTSGVIGLRVSAVAAAAGTSMALLFKYFGDRDGLVTEVLGGVYSEFTHEDILNAKKWLLNNDGAALVGPEIIDLFPSPFSEHVRERRIWVARIISASFELPKLRLKLEEIHEQSDREFEQVVTEVHSLISGRKHFSPQVMRSVLRGLSFGHIFTEMNYSRRPSEEEWRAFITFLLSTT